MISDEDIIKALDSRDRRTQPVWTSSDFQEHFGVKQPTVLRWLITGRGVGKKPGLVAQGKIRERTSGSTRYYTMPEDTVVRGVPTASSSNVGVALHKYGEFKALLTKWRSVALGVTVLYFLIRLTAKQPLIDEFTVWGLILICSMMFMEAHINQTLRCYEKPPNGMIESLKAAWSIPSISGAVGTGVMVYLIFGYFDYVAQTSAIVGAGVVGLEAAILIFAGLNAKFMIGIADTML